MAVVDERKAVCVVYTDRVVELVVDYAVSVSSPVPRFVFVFTRGRGIVSFSGCFKLFISAVGYGVPLTCVAVTCTTFLTAVAVAALLVVGRCTAHCLECFSVVHRVLSAVPVVVVASGSSVAWRCVVGTTGAPVVPVVLPRLAPGVTLSVVWCITGIVVVSGDPGLPLCQSQFSVEKVANLSLTSDLS